MVMKIIQFMLGTSRSVDRKRHDWGCCSQLCQQRKQDMVSGQH